MAKMVVLSCELDGEIDSAENRVVTANVCGHRVELCQKHRVQLLTLVGVSEEHAVAYTNAFDRRVGHKGANPTIAQVLEELGTEVITDNEDQADAEAVAEALSSELSEGDTVVEAGPVKKRR
jgi:3-deoxy-D-manno-octulosonic acid (KDO) 8-phosphate synthase